MAGPAMTPLSLMPASRRPTSSTLCDLGATAMLQMERLEDRTLLTATPRVIGCLADNRGEVVIALNRSLKDTTVTRQSAQVYTAGADGVLGNTDDIKVIAPVFWNG